MTKQPQLNIKCFKNEDNNSDKYTVVFLDSRVEKGKTYYDCVGLGGHSTCVLGRHLGEEIKFGELPAGLQRVVLRDLELTVK